MGNPWDFPMLPRPNPTPAFGRATSRRPMIDPTDDGPLSDVLRGLDRLHGLERRGRAESPEADAVRDALDAPWHALDDEARSLADRYSAALGTGDYGAALDAMAEYWGRNPGSPPVP